MQYQPNHIYPFILAFLQNRHKDPDPPPGFCVQQRLPDFYYISLAICVILLYTNYVCTSETNNLDRRDVFRWMDL